MNVGGTRQVANKTPAETTGEVVDMWGVDQRHSATEANAARPDADHSDGQSGGAVHATVMPTMTHRSVRRQPDTDQVGGSAATSVNRWWPLAVPTARRKRRLRERPDHHDRAPLNRRLNPTRAGSVRPSREFNNSGPRPVGKRRPTVERRPTSSSKRRGGLHGSPPWRNIVNASRRRWNPANPRAVVGSRKASSGGNEGDGAITVRRDRSGRQPIPTCPPTTCCRQ